MVKISIRINSVELNHIYDDETEKVRINLVDKTNEKYFPKSVKIGELPSLGQEWEINLDELTQKNQLFVTFRKNKLIKEHNLLGTFSIDLSKFNDNWMYNMKQKIFTNHKSKIQCGEVEYQVIINQKAINILNNETNEEPVF